MLVTNESEDGCWLDVQIVQVTIDTGTKPYMVPVYLEWVVAPKVMQEFEKHTE